MNEYERQCNVVHGLRRKLEEATRLYGEACVRVESVCDDAHATCEVR